MVTNHEQEGHVQKKGGEDEQNDTGGDLTSNKLRKLTTFWHVASKDLK